MNKIEQDKNKKITLVVKRYEIKKKKARKLEPCKNFLRAIFRAENS